MAQEKTAPTREDFFFQEVPSRLFSVAYIMSKGVVRHKAREEDRGFVERDQGKNLIHSLIGNGRHG